MKEDTVKRIFRAIKDMEEPEYGKVTIVFRDKRPVHAICEKVLGKPKWVGIGKV